MSRDKIDKKILDKILSSQKIKGMRLQSVRNAVSKIRKNNQGITMNAAASEFAKRKGFSVYRYLSDSDKSSLQHLKISSNTYQEPKNTVKRQRKVTEPKFDFETPFISDAYNNAKVYPYIYVLENSLRKVIFDHFGKGRDWWQNTKIVPKPIQEYAEKIKESEKKYPWVKSRGDHPIYFVGLFELFKIIETNWQNFKRIFNNDLEQLRSWIKESVPIRNLIAHNVPTRNKERIRIETNTDYICRMIEKSGKA